MSKHVERKQVYRWYVNGKGYGTRRSAYLFIAKRLLRNDVFGGEDFPLLDDRIEELTKALPGYERDRCGEDNTTDEQKREIFHQAWDELMAEKFPHGNHYWCTLDFNGECRRKTGTEFVFKSCRAAINQWLDAKVKELQAEDHLCGSV